MQHGKPCRLLPSISFTSLLLLSRRLPTNDEGLERHRPPHRLLLQLAGISGGAPAQGEGCPACCWPWGSSDCVPMSCTPYWFPLTLTILHQQHL